MKRLILVLMLAGQTFGMMYLQDGGTWDISVQIDDFVSVDLVAPNNPTTVNLLVGGDIGRDAYALYAYNDSNVNISGGSINALSAFDDSNVTVTGGVFHKYLTACDNSNVNIFGGNLKLEARNNSTVTFHGYDFEAGTGLALGGDHVLGTGILAGKWFDGTSWTIDIHQNASTATILVTPEPCTLLLFGTGVVILQRRWRQ